MVVIVVTLTLLLLLLLLLLLYLREKFWLDKADFILSIEYILNMHKWNINIVKYLLATGVIRIPYTDAKWLYYYSYYYYYYYYYPE
jgi:hypothetical protein